MAEQKLKPAPREQVQGEDRPGGRHGRCRRRGSSPSATRRSARRPARFSCAPNCRTRTGHCAPASSCGCVLSGASWANAIQLPQRAVMQGPQGNFVWVVDAESKGAVPAGHGGPLERRPVADRRRAAAGGSRRRGRRAQARAGRAGEAGRAGPAACGRPFGNRRLTTGGLRVISDFCIRRPIFASVLSIVVTLARPRGARRPARRAVPADRAADRDGVRELPRRRRRDASPRPSPRRSRRR